MAAIARFRGKQPSDSAAEASLFRLSSGDRAAVCGWGYRTVVVAKLADSAILIDWLFLRQSLVELSPPWSSQDCVLVRASIKDATFATFVVTPNRSRKLSHIFSAASLIEVCRDATLSRFLDDEAIQSICYHIIGTMLLVVINSLTFSTFTDVANSSRMSR